MKFLIVLLFLPIVTFSQITMQLSLDDALKIGQEKSKMLAISSAKVKGASAKSTEATASTLPSLKFNGGYTRLSDVPPFQIQPPGAPAPFTVAPTVLDNYNLRVSLQQPIFTGFKLHSNARVMEYLATASEFDFQSDKNDVTLSVTAAYWTLYQTIEAKKFIDENVNRLQMYHRDTENLMNAGLATRNDLLKIEVQLSNAKLTQIDATNDVQVAMMNLNNAIGQPIDTQLQLTSVPNESGTATISESYEALVEKAFHSRSDVQSMYSRIEASKAGVSATQGNYFPQIYLTGNYYYNRPNVRYQPTLDAFKSTWDVGVQAQFDIWNWSTTSSQVEQTRAVLTQNEIQFEQMKDNIFLEVKRNLLSVQRAKEKIAVARLGVTQGEENARTMSDKYKAGLATSTELLDADVALLQTKTNYSGALVEQELAYAKLKKSAGGELK